MHRMLEPVSENCWKVQSAERNCYIECPSIRCGTCHTMISEDFRGLQEGKVGKAYLAYRMPSSVKMPMWALSKPMPLSIKAISSSKKPRCW